MRFDASSFQATHFDQSAIEYSSVDFAAESGFVGDLNVRQQCLSAKLAAVIVSRAYEVSADFDDKEVIAGLAQVLGRISRVRQACLKLVEIDEKHEDFATVFRIATSISLDVVTEEYKWRKIDAKVKELPLNIFKRVMEVVSVQQPTIYVQSSGHFDSIASRRLSTLKIAPSMMGLVNLFDYYAKDTSAVVSRLIYSVVKEAEYHAIKGIDGLSDGGKAFLIQRVYEVSQGVMVEVYKACAKKDVMKLGLLQEFDRCFEIESHIRNGGMDYEHIILEHRRVMKKTFEVCDLVVSAQAGEMEVN